MDAPTATDIPALGAAIGGAGAVLEGGSAVDLHTEDGLDLTAGHAPATEPGTGVTVLMLPGTRAPASPGYRSRAL